MRHWPLKLPAPTSGCTWTLLPILAVFGDPNQVREQAESLLAMVMDRIVVLSLIPLLRSLWLQPARLLAACRISLA